MKNIMIAGFYVHGEVDRVIDGDTVDVMVGSLVFRIRLLDCWAAEIRTRDAFEKTFGLKAKEQLEFFIPKGKAVKVEVSLSIDGDFSDWLTFGRVVGRIIRQADGDDASRFMCHVGMAAETKAGLAELLELRRFEAEAEERKAAERIKEGGGR